MRGLRGSLARSAWQTATALAVCILLPGGQPLPGQQAESQPVSPASQSSSPGAQPGTNAQVHTGITSGIETETRLQNLLADHQFLRLAAQLNQLPPQEAQFYRGILANRSNDSKTSIQLLEPLVAPITASGDKSREKLLRKALAEDYLRLGDWKKAAEAYQALASHLQNQLSSDEQYEIEMPLKLLPLAEDKPPMTVEPCAPFSLQVSKDPLGLIDVPVFVDARPHSWMLDPTAPFNLIARSLAREVGLKVSPEFATIHSLTGKPMQVHAAVIPRFTIGGRLTLRNMTVFVYNDEDYYFPRSGYRVQGVLGYAALSALGSLTVTADDTIKIQPAREMTDSSAREQAATGSPFFLDGNRLLVDLGTAENERIYEVDEGSQQTYLTSRYYNEQSDDFAGQQMELLAIPGAETMPPQPAFVAETVSIPMGTPPVRIHYIQVLTQPLDSAVMDDVYGVLGIDALDQLKSYTFDYRTMRFSAQGE
jgi:hypothetical protein